MPKVLALASGGGHWVQLMRLRPVFGKFDTVFATVDRAYSNDVPEQRFYTFRDSTRWNKIGLVLTALKILLIIVRERPDVVITTGAAPGYFAIRIGRVFKARTCWIDSMANVDRISMAGTMAKPHSDLWLTQWKHIADEMCDDKVLYRGSVI